MFSQTERTLIKKLGIAAEAYPTDVVAYRSQDGLIHDSNTCDVRSPFVSYDKVPVTIGEDVALCSCVFPSSVDPLKLLAMVKLGLRDAVVAMELLAAALRVSDRTHPDELMSVHSQVIQVVTSRTPLHGLLPGTLQDNLQDTYGRLRSEALPLISSLGMSAVVNTYGVVNACDVVSKYYRRGDFQTRAAFDSMLMLWRGMALRNVPVAERRRLMLRLVGGVAEGWDVSPRTLGMRTKMWLRDAERLLAEAPGLLDANKRRLAVYGNSSSRSHVLELKVFTIRKAFGSTLVAIPDLVRRDLARRNIFPNRCADGYVTAEVAEVAAALWSREPNDTFNDLGNLVEAASIVLA